MYRGDGKTRDGHPVGSTLWLPPDSWDLPDSREIRQRRRGPLPPYRCLYLYLVVHSHFDHIVSVTVGVHLLSKFLYTLHRFRNGSPFKYRNLRKRSFTLTSLFGRVQFLYLFTQIGVSLNPILLMFLILLLVVYLL